MSILINIFLALEVVVALLIIFIVLMQRPKNEGLGAAFGGGMTDNIFGAQTTNVLATITRWLGGLFFGLTLLLSWMYAHQTTKKSELGERLSAGPTAVSNPTTPGATPAPGTAGAENSSQVPPAPPATTQEPPAADAATPPAAGEAPAAPAPEAASAPVQPAPATPAAPAGDVAPATPTEVVPEPAAPASETPAAAPAPAPEAAPAPAPEASPAPAADAPAQAPTQEAPAPAPAP